MLKRNVIANFIGQGWTALMGLAFVPVYINYLGIESYGLIGLFAVLQTWLVLLDMGMTPALGREMARLKSGILNIQALRDLLRSVETAAVLLALGICAGFWLISDQVANNWLKVESLSANSVAYAFSIIGVVSALRFIEGIYRNSIMGLQRQVLLNIITGIMATVRGLGAVGILIYISPTLEAFFIWQGVVSLITLVIFALITYQSLPSAERGGRFSLAALQKIWRFATGMLSITFLSLLLMQLDKIILSRIIPLTEFGYYMLASAIATLLTMTSHPISQALFPRLVELHAQKDCQKFIETYHQGSQLVTVTTGSAAVVLFVFSEQILFLWTKDIELARQTATLLNLLALGNFINALMLIPYQAQLACGWTSLAVKINSVAVVCLIPLMLWVAPRYGAEGAAAVWILLNLSYLIIGVQVMYLKILQTEKWAWYKYDVTFPFCAALTCALIIDHTFHNEDKSLFLQFFEIGVAVCTVPLAAALASSKIRSRLNPWR